MFHPIDFLCKICYIGLKGGKIMREKYVKPDCELMEFQHTADILTTSDSSGNNQNNLNNDDQYNYIP